jgi:hypothetical protein
VRLNGQIVSVHKRLDKNNWRYDPPGFGELTAFVIGDLTVTIGFVDESQWGVFGVLDAHAIHAGIPIVGISTRSASNAHLMKDVQFSGDLYACGQNDDPGRKWLDDLAAVRSFRYIPVPDRFHDVDEWLKDGPDAHKAFMQAWNSAKKYRSGFPPELVSGEEIETVFVPEPPSLIEGVLYQGEKLQLAAGSKMGKSWVLIDQGICVAAGIPWWGFPTIETPVIYFNLEIIRHAFDKRVREIAAAHQIKVPKLFNVWYLRDEEIYDPTRWELLKNALIDVCQNGLPNPLLILDPLYMLMDVDSNENSTGDVRKVMVRTGELVKLINGSNSTAHHFSKGGQSAKEAIDRSSGSGVFQRYPDSIFPMTEHGDPGCFAIEPYVRNHQPLKKFVVRWQYPIFVRDDSLDPKNLKGKKSQAHNYIDPVNALKFIGIAEEISKSEFKTRLITPDSKGRCFCSDRTADKVIKELIANGELIEDTTVNPHTVRKP